MLKLNAGNWITIAILVIGMITTFSVSSYRLNAVEARYAEISQQVDALSICLTELETSQEWIMASLTRIENKLDRIEVGYPDNER